MQANKPHKAPLHYKRTKDGLEIKGEPSDVKWLAWFDQVSSKLKKLPLLAVFSKIPVVSILAKGWRWLHSHFRCLIFLPVAAGWFCT